MSKKAGAPALKIAHKKSDQLSPSDEPRCTCNGVLPISALSQAENELTAMFSTLSLIELIRESMPEAEDGLLKVICQQDDAGIKILDEYKQHFAAWDREKLTVKQAKQLKAVKRLGAEKHGNFWRSVRWL